MKTSLFVVSITLVAVALSGCSASIGYPPVRGDVMVPLYAGAVVNVYNPSPYDQYVSIDHAIYKNEVVAPFFLPSRNTSGDIILPQGKYVIRAEAIDIGKRINRTTVIPASGYVLIKTSM